MGFSEGGRERQFLKLTGGDEKDGKGGLYVCRFIDNFGEHVLNSPLSKRGVGVAGESPGEEDDLLHRLAGVLGVWRWSEVRDDDKG